MKIILILLVFVSSSLTRAQIPQDRLRVMSWNIQNLFDAEHDEGKDDWEFLPMGHPMKEQGCQKNKIDRYRESCLKNDWSRTKLIMKYKQIKKMIDSVGGRPDVLAVLEVENANVLRELAQVLGYKHFVMTSTDDERGVDLALFYNEKPGFKMLGYRDVAIPLPSATRPILQVLFSFNNARLDFYVNHWPATGSPTQQRIIAAKALRQAIDQSQPRTRSQAPVYSVALGDFNVTRENTPNPLEVLYDKNWNNSMYDLDSVARHYVRIPTLGTYFASWKMEWAILDRIILSKNFFEQKLLKLPVNRYQIVTTLATDYTSRPDPVTGQVQTMKQVPFRYNANAKQEKWLGFSDHFPIMFDIVAGRP